MIVLYSTHCSKCRVLETKLRQKGIEFSEVNDLDRIISTGFRSAPLLEVAGKIMPFQEAINWVNEHES